MEVWKIDILDSKIDIKIDISRGIGEARKRPEKGNLRGP